jgi:predicted transposase YbfD/YdcC
VLYPDRVIVNILEHFSTLPDTRRDHPSKLHKLIDIIVITLCAMLAKCDTWEEIADYAAEQHEFFKQFLELPNGIPSHDTINRTFSLIDPILWQQLFASWMQLQTLESFEKIKHIQIDGKVLCASRSTGTGKRADQPKEPAVEIVSAWSSEHQLVLGHVTVESTSNEIKAVPVLLKLLDLEGTLVSLDAMGCQKDTTDLIIEGGGDYLVALKGNQGTLHQAAQDLFEDVLKDQGNTRENPERNSSFDVGHGREEERTCYVLKDLKQLAMADCNVESWRDLKCLIVVEAKTVRQGKTSFERRYFLSSKDWTAEDALEAVRGHWSIENQQHYVLDMVFCEDASRTRRGFAAENLGLIRRLALNLLNLDVSMNISKRRKRLRALLNPDYLLSLLGLSVKA